MARLVRILSLDGGGIRGIIPGVILHELETRLQDRDGPDARIADYFDLIAGTSTGGILACGYLVPDPETGRPKHTAQEVVNFYLDHGPAIFKASAWQAVTGLGLFNEKYDEKPLERALGELLGTTLLSQLVKPCLIPAYDIANREAVFFDQISARDRIARDYLLTAVARATSAAPTYFAPEEARSELGVRYPLIDGGVFANNPAMCAYAEARKTDFAKALAEAGAPVEPQADEMLMLSIGTGRVVKSYPFEEAKDWGLVQWAQPILDIMMSGAAETVSYQLKLVFETVKGRVAYRRWQPELRKASHDMDRTDRENLDLLQQEALYFVAKKEDELDAVADDLIAAGPAG